MSNPDENHFSWTWVNDRRKHEFDLSCLNRDRKTEVNFLNTLFNNRQGYRSARLTELNVNDHKENLLRRQSSSDPWDVISHTGWRKS